MTLKGKHLRIMSAQNKDMFNLKEKKTVYFKLTLCSGHQRCDNNHCKVYVHNDSTTVRHTMNL